MTTNPSRILRLGLTAAVIAVTGLAGCSTSDMPTMDHGSTSSTAPSTPAGAPSTSATPADGPHNDADEMFASMMIRTTSRPSR